MNLELLKKRYAVCKLDNLPKLPEQETELYSLSLTDRELSLVCPEDLTPAGAVKTEPGWRAFQIAGPLEFSQTGVLARLTTVLSKEKIPVFTISTYDTDIILVKDEYIAKAVFALEKEGYLFI